MSFLNFLRDESNAFGVRLLILFSLVGLISGLIIAVIITSAGGNSKVNFKNLILFGICIAAYVRIRKYAMDESSSVVEGVITKLRIRICDKIRHAELVSVEDIGKERFYTCLAQDTMTVSEAAKVVSGLFSSTFLLIVGFLYIAYLSTPAFYTSIGLTGVAVVIYRRISGELERDLIQASLQENRFFGLLNHLLDGFKELKLSRKKSDDFLDNHLKATANETEELKKRSSEKLSQVVIFAQTFFYCLMGFMIFIFPTVIDIESTDLIQIVTIILFITSGPLSEAVGALPYVERANVAVNNLCTMEKELERITAGLEELEKSAIKIRPFQSLRCEGITFDYRGKGQEKLFHIGPIDFELKAGEVVFLMGGNGAGKSTFLKLLTGLYQPADGEIYWNDRAVSPQNIAAYRANFSAIMQDYHLFERLYGTGTIDLDRAEEMLHRMQLDHKTSIREDGSFQSITLSAGQKKRLALIVSEFDDCNICIFDEWAADQDPGFRKFFYEEYLPLLKQRGKTVLAVTHDDRYYHTADRILKMEYGKINGYSE